MPFSHYEKRAEVRKSFEGLEMNIPKKTCLLSVFVFVVNLIAFYFIFFKKIDKDNFSLFNFFILFAILHLFVSMIYQSFVQERITINHNKLLITYHIFGYKRNKEYDIANIHDFGLRNNNPSRKLKNIIVYPKFSFLYKNNKEPITFGKNISFEEAQDFFQRILDNRYIPENKLHKMNIN